MASDTPQPHLRMSVLGVVVLSLFAALFARLWYLQVMAAPTFEVQAESNRQRVVSLAPMRGRILDRHGRVLADNRLSNVVVADRTAIANKERRTALFTRLAPVIGQSIEEMERRYNDSRYSPLLPVPLAEDVPEGVVVHLRERQDAYPGVEARQEALREYPYGSLAAHVIGYVGLINDQELAARADRGYTLSDIIGKEGVERAFEDDLRGTPGSVTLEVDSRGRVLRELDRVDPVPGADVQLTIDIDVQWLVERSLVRTLEARREQRPSSRSPRYAAPAGSVVVQDPRDGSVIAMASYPTYDPREFVGGIAQDRYAQLLDPASHFPLNNRAIQGQYAPGSTFKVVTALAGLMSGAITPGTVVNDPGYYVVPNCTGETCRFQNAGGAANGPVRLVKAIAASSDVYFYSIGADLYRFEDRFGRALQDTARAFGLGSPTGIPLPNERSGRVPTPEQKAAMHEQNPQAFPEGRWFAGDSVNLAIGQGELLLTPMQLASVYSTLANGGTVLAPNLLLRTLEPGSVDAGRPETLRTGGPRAIGQVAMPPEVRDPILQGLREAVGTESGTAHAAFAGFPLDQFAVAGKTGTAQTANKAAQFDNSLFVGFGPVGDPRYVVVAVLEEAGFGSQAAAPLVRRVFEALAGVTELRPAPHAPPVGQPVDPNQPDALDGEEPLVLSGSSAD